jgi:hypothetical protein
MDATALQALILLAFLDVETARGIGVLAKNVNEINHMRRTDGGAFI